MSTSTTFCMLQKALGQKILLSSERCSPTPRRLVSRLTPASHASLPTNLNTWVITSLVTGLCPYKESQGHLHPHIPKYSQTIAPVYWYDQIISWHVAKVIWSLCPINCINLKNFKYEWYDEHKKCFDAIKRVIGREVLLAHPDFNAPFEIHTDASKL